MSELLIVICATLFLMVIAGWFWFARRKSPFLGFGLVVLTLLFVWITSRSLTMAEDDAADIQARWFFKRLIGVV